MGRVIFVVFLIGWSTATIALDRHFGSAIVRQVQASGFPTVAADILESRIEQTGSGKKGASYKPVIRYRYTHAGQTHESDQWRYLSVPTNMKRDSTRVVARFPLGSRATAYVNPRDPTDAVLAPGIQGLDAFMILFMVPFNTVMIGGWVAAAGWFGGIGPSRPRPNGNVRIWESGGVTVARLECAWSPFYGAVAAVFIFSIPAALIVAFGFGFNGPPAAALTAIVLVILLAVVTYARGMGALTGGRYDLVLDDVRRTLVLPPEPETERREVPFATVQKVEVAEVAATPSDDPSVWEVRLVTRDREKFTILKRSERKDAAAFAAWLAGRIGVAA